MSIRNYTLTKLTPQAQKVLRHLIKYGSITNVEAHNILKVRSVSRRITEIQDVEYVVVEKDHRVDEFGQRYVRYTLTEREREYARGVLEGTAGAVH